MQSPGIESKKEAADYLSHTRQTIMKFLAITPTEPVLVSEAVRFSYLKVAKPCDTDYGLLCEQSMYICKRHLF